MGAIEYQDKFTLDGLIKPHFSVNKRKVEAIKKAFEGGLRGNKQAAAIFAESVSTTDAIHAQLHLTLLQVLPQFQKRERTWSKIASVRELPNFKPVVLRGIFGGLQNLATMDEEESLENPAGTAPVVPEGGGYPYATIGDTEAAWGRLKKRGFKVGWTWEDQINSAEDTIDFYRDIPAEMLEVALDTEEWEVYQALLNGVTTASQLQGGAIYDGTLVPANASFSRPALDRAIEELKLREVNGRQIDITSGLAVLVPLGRKKRADYLLSLNAVQLVPGADGGTVFTISNSQSETESVEVIETKWVTGENWYVLPKPGGVRRPFLELGRLRNHTTPELRINNMTGTYVGGGSVSPFEGNFDNDSIDLRLRYPITGILWSALYVVWSTGTGGSASGGAGGGTTPAAVAPTVSTQPEDVATTVGTPALFTVAFAGTPAPAIQWQRRSDDQGAFSDIPGAVGTVYQADVLNIEQDGAQYRAVATNSAGTVTSAIAALEVSIAS